MSLVADRLDGFDPAQPGSRARPRRPRRGPRRAAREGRSRARGAANARGSRARRRATRPRLGQVAPARRRRSRPRVARRAVAWASTAAAAAGLAGGDAAADGDPRAPAAPPGRPRPGLVVSLWRDAAPLLSRLDDLRRDVVLVTLTAAIIAAAVLFLVFRSAQRRITRQTAALVRRRTGIDAPHRHAQPRCARRAPRPPDGASPARRHAATRRSRCSTSTTSGCSTTPTATAPATTCCCSWSQDTSARGIPAEMTIGRYGPDEFLRRRRRATAVGRAARARSTPHAARRCAASAVEFDGAERLPVTVSSGAVPVPGGRRLGHRAARDGRVDRPPGGQGRRRRPGAWPPTPTCRGGPAISSFDVFQGLDPRDRRQGPLHEAPLARTSPGTACSSAGASGLDEDTLAHDPASPACSTTWARSASRTRCCASRAS